MAKGRLWGARSGSGEAERRRKGHGQRIEARPCDLKMCEQRGSKENGVGTR